MNTNSNPPPDASEVLALISKTVEPLESQRLPLHNALGRVLREAVTAPEDQPPFDRSSVDGYAIREDDPSTVLRIIEDIRAGDWKPRALERGEAVRIATGGALPTAGLKVVMREHAEAREGSLRIRETSSERNIRFRGEDARAGQTLIQPGTLVRHGTVGLLASLGCTTPTVTRLPRVLHVVTGNEIVPPEATPGPGQIRDSNSSLVGAFLALWHITPTRLHVPEDEAVALSAVGGAVSPHTTVSPSAGPPTRTSQDSTPGAVDLLLVSGGASVGEHDFTKRLLQNLGYTIHVGRTSARPGKPLIFGQSGSSFAFGLPGNPLAHFVCLNLYVRAALEKFSGAPVPQAEFHKGFLETSLQPNLNARQTLWPARWQVDNRGRVLLTPLRWQSSGDLTSLAAANALLCLTQPSTVSPRPLFEAGSEVDFIFTHQRYEK